MQGGRADAWEVHAHVSAAPPPVLELWARLCRAWTSHGRGFATFAERVHRDFASVMPEGDDHRQSRLTIVFLISLCLRKGWEGGYMGRNEKPQSQVGPLVKNGGGGGTQVAGEGGGGRSKLFFQMRNLIFLWFTTGVPLPGWGTYAESSLKRIRGNV